MSQPITYSVVHRTLTASTLELDGSTSYDDIPLESITFKKNTPLGGKIKKTASSGVINVTSTDYTNLSNVPVPFDLTLNIEDPGDGYIHVDSVGYPGFAAAYVQHVSETRGLAPAAAEPEVQRAHDVSAEILSELRKLNEGVGTIQRLFNETREMPKTLSRTGTDND